MALRKKRHRNLEPINCHAVALFFFRSTFATFAPDNDAEVARWRSEFVPALTMKAPTAPGAPTPSLASTPAAYYSDRDLAQKFKVSVRTIKRWRAKGGYCTQDRTQQPH